MGLVKSEWMEAQERGWSAPDTHVCADCVEDQYLKQLIQDTASSNCCDYCGCSAATFIAAEASIVVEAIYDAVWAYYCEPAAGGVPYDHGFIIEPIDIDEVLRNLSFDGHPDFVEAIISAEMNGNVFVPAANGYWADSHRHEVLSSAWRSFVRTVKHEARFHFANSPRLVASSPNEIEPYETLPEIAEHLRPLIRTLMVGTQVYRSRVRSRRQTWTPTADQMGAPPKERASAGRMNPAGIPYLYTAFDKTTARREVGITKRTSLTVFTATFELTKPLNVIDLTILPAIPSLFDVQKKDGREHALFIRQFVNEISVAVAKDGQEHIEYVPTQVVCEYLAQVFEPNPETKLGGLIFPSTVHPGGKNLVVFPDDRYAGTFHGVRFVQ